MINILNLSNQPLYTIKLSSEQAKGRVGFPACLCQTQMGSSEELAQKPRVSPGQVYISNSDLQLAWYIRTYKTQETIETIETTGGWVF